MEEYKKRKFPRPHTIKFKNKNQVKALQELTLWLEKHIGQFHIIDIVSGVENGFHTVTLYYRKKQEKR